MIWRQMFLGRNRLIFRLPKEYCSPDGSNWVILPRDKWHVNEVTLTVQPSVILDGEDPASTPFMRHFTITNGNVCFCPDDSVSPNQKAPLPVIAQNWIDGLIDIISPQKQPPTVLPGTDY